MKIYIYTISRGKPLNKEERVISFSQNALIETNLRYILLKSINSSDLNSRFYSYKRLTNRQKEIIKKWMLFHYESDSKG